MLTEKYTTGYFLTSNWPFRVHKLQYFHKITYSEIREYHVCIPTFPRIVCEGNTSNIKQKKGNKGGWMGETRRGRHQICQYKQLLLRAPLPRGNIEGKRQAWVFHQDFSE